MSRLSMIVVGSAALSLLFLPQTRAASTPSTGLWNSTSDRAHYTFSDAVFHGREEYRYRCQFLKADETVMHRVCTGEKSRLTGDAKLITRDIDGQIVALSTVINITNTEPNQIATVIDGTMMSYLIGKFTDIDQMMARAKQARVKLLDDVEKRGRVVYQRGDATITAYLRGVELHIDVDKPQDDSSAE